MSQHINHPNVRFFIGDVRDEGRLQRALNVGIDIVIHAAASTEASRYLTHYEEEKINIISGTLNYCRLALKFHKK